MPLRSFYWSIIQVATVLTKPCSVSDLFGGWLGGFSKELKPLLLGASVTFWSLSLIRNDIVFQKKKTCSSCAGYLFGHPPATYLGYSTEGVS